MKTTKEQIYFLPAMTLLQFILMYVLTSVTHFTDAQNILISGMFQIFFTILAIYICRAILQADWEVFRKNLFRHFMLCCAFALCLPVILIISRVVMGMFSHASAALSTPSSEGTQSLPLIILIFSAVTSCLSPITEELTFRHALFYQFTNKAIRTLMLFVSSILFGFAHVLSFGGQFSATIPYIFVGLFLGLIYQFSKNIYFSLTTHFLFNFSVTTLGIISTLLIG